MYCGDGSTPWARNGIPTYTAVAVSDAVLKDLITSPIHGFRAVANRTCSNPVRATRPMHLLHMHTSIYVNMLL